MWAAIATSVFLISFLFGRLFAAANVTDYSSPDEARIFLAANMKLEVREAGTVNLTLSTPDRTYSYPGKDGNVSVVESQVRRKSTKRWKMLELERASDFVTLGAVPASGGLFELVATTVSLERFTKLKKIVLWAGTALTAGSGGLVGYYSAYSDPQDYGNPVFQAVLQDPTNWQPVFERMRTCGLSRQQPPLPAQFEYAGLTVEVRDEKCIRLLRWVKARL